MDVINEAILKHRRAVVGVFLVVAALCAVMIFGVKVNFNMVDYLPESAQSTKAVQIMEDEFTTSMPNASVMVKDVQLTEALAYKEKLKELDGVTEVLWLDDALDIKQPLAVLDSETVETYYKNQNALFSVTVEETKEVETVTEIRALIGDDNAVSGDAVDTAAMQGALDNEVGSAVFILVPLIILVLVLSTRSWIEPVLFLGAIGVSVLMNMGTNLIFGEVSFVTFSITPILQLAVSLDYAIFLLHSFGDFRAETNDPFEAMKRAMKRSVRTVAASACTTLFGFLALTFMEFGIGADLGLSLAKGIILSFLSCMIFLPALTICCYKLIDKTQHRAFMPSFKNVWRVLSKIAIPVTVVVILLAVPSYMAQGENTFSYQNTDKSPTSRNARDTQMISDEFGQSTIVAALVPVGDIVKEAELSDALAQLDHVTGVMSFANAVGTGIPVDFLDDAITAQFYSENYARIVVYTNTPTEGDVAFATVEDIHQTIGEYYDEFYTAGQSANLYDMSNVVSADNIRVNLIAIVSIFLVLLLTFRSATLPFILLFTIEVGIWINLSIPYFTSSNINFLGYLVISTVQLGATVDYAILLTSYYIENRKRMTQKVAIKTSLGEAFKSILVSATTLSVAGFTLAATSSNPAVAEIGNLLGRGTIMSMVMVVCLLPILLTIFDALIGKTTYKAQFFRAPRRAIQNSKESQHE